MKRLWYRICHWLCVHVYYERATVRHRERLPAGGPVIYLGTHRNGAVDGFLYHQVVPRCEYLISTQLVRGLLPRIFFDGIPVARTEDGGDREQHGAALARCREFLQDGGELFIFPEGTSTLGPRHLPFRSGAVRIALDCLARGLPLRLVPIGIHYERAWAFRSRVEIEIGEPIDTAFADGATPVQRLGELKRRCAAALERVGANFKSGPEQAEAEMLAYAATLGTTCSYYAALKRLESGLPEGLRERWRDLTAESAGQRLWRHQGVPLFPTRAMVLYALPLAVLAPVVIAGALVNLPPLLASGLAAGKFADDRNVIALWRILVGLPVLALWSVALTATLIATAGWPWALGYLVLSLAALKAWYRVKKLAVATGNGLRHAELGARLRVFHQNLLQLLSWQAVPDTRDPGAPS